MAVINFNSPLLEKTKKEYFQTDFRCRSKIKFLKVFLAYVVVMAMGCVVVAGVLRGLVILPSMIKSLF